MDLAQAKTRLATYLRDLLLDDNGGVDPSLSHLHWGDADLEVCLTGALGVLALVKADTFRKRFTLTTVAGSIQDVPEGCDECLNVLGVLRDDGSLDTGALRRVKSSATLGLPLCKDASGKPGPTEVTITEDDTTLIFNPPAVAGEQVVITCKYVPSFDDSDSLDAKFEAPLFFIAVSLAFGQDIESVQSRERSDSNWNKAMMLLSVNAAAAASARRQATGA